MDEGVHISFAVPAICLFDGADTEFLAHLVEDEALKPVERIDDDGSEVVFLVPEGGQFGDDVTDVLCERELAGVDLAEAVLGLDEDGVGSGCPEGRLYCTPLRDVLY